MLCFFLNQATNHSKTYCLGFQAALLCNKSSSISHHFEILVFVATFEDNRGKNQQNTGSFTMAATSSCSWVPLSFGVSSAC